MNLPVKCVDKYWTNYKELHVVGKIPSPPHALKTKHEDDIIVVT